MTMTIVTALAAGAAAAAKDTAEKAIQDAYAGLKHLIQGKFAGHAAADLALRKHEEKPDTWREPLKEALTETGADQDPQIAQAAQNLLQLLGRSGGAHVIGDGAAATGHGVAAGRGGSAAGRDMITGKVDWKRRREE